MSELLKKTLPWIREAYGALELDRLKADAGGFKGAAELLTARIEEAKGLMAEVEAAAEAPTLDTIAAEVAGEILRYYFSDAPGQDRRHHICEALVAGARLFTDELFYVGNDLWVASTT